jgi:hypothetical protein
MNFARGSQVSRFDSLSQAIWLSSFGKLVEAKQAELKPQWEADWPTRCDGKRFFNDLYKNVKIRIPKAKLKRDLIRALRVKQKQPWVELRNIVVGMLGDSGD